MALLGGAFALVVALAIAHSHHQLAQLVAVSAPAAAFIGGAGGPSFGGPPSTFLNDTWRPTSGRALVTGSSLVVTATTTSVQDFSIAGTCFYQGVDCATAFGGGGASSDPLTAAHWSSTSGTDTMTTTAMVESNLEFSGAGGVTGQIQGLGGVSTTASDSGTRANTLDLTGTLTENGGLTWQKSAFCTGMGVSANQFYPSTGASPSCSDVDTGGGDGFVEAVLAVAPGENNIGLIFRWDNSNNNGYQLLFFNDGSAYVNQYSGPAGGSVLTVFSAFCHSAPDNGLVLRADYAGTLVTLSCNGSAIGTFNDSTMTANTFSGMYYGAHTGVTTRMVDWSTSGGGADKRVLFSPLGGAQTLEESFAVFLADQDLHVTGASALHAVTATTIAASGQITSTVATGTAPLVIASTTKCTNLNADLLDGFDSSTFYPSPTLNDVNANTVQVIVQFGLDDHPRGICGPGREGDINYDAGHFYGCDGTTWLLLEH